MKTIPLSKGKSCKVDDCEYEKLALKKWHLVTGGYAGRSEKNSDGKPCIVTIHRMLMNAPKGMEVDHINGDRLDNQRHNLRIVTPRQNQWNTMAKKAGASGARGVFLRKNGKWAFRICGSGYKTKEEAMVDYNKGLAAIRGGFAILHKIPSCEEVVESRDPLYHDEP